MRLTRRLVVLALLGGFLLIGRTYFTSIEIGASAESVRHFVRDTGWWGPPAFVTLFLFRSVLLLPSVVLLTAGGVCFGLIGGAVLGALGLTFSAVVKFLVAHLAGREQLLARLPARWRTRLAAIDRRSSAGTLGLVTAYPMGPAELLHIAAILSGMGALPFVSSVAMGSLVRAGSFSLFGDAITEGKGLVVAAAVLTLAALLPLSVPAFRHLLFAAAAPPTSESVVPVSRE